MFEDISLTKHLKELYSRYYDYAALDFDDPEKIIRSFDIAFKMNKWILQILRTLSICANTNEGLGESLIIDDMIKQREIACRNLLKLKRKKLAACFAYCESRL